MTPEIYESCSKIRHTEEALVELFSSGKMNGTIHTCVGQELSSYFIINALTKSDVIFSNHRCHGHYLHRFDDIPSLIGELMGKSNGVCSGIGSSQHLCRDGFFSNGIQGGIVPLGLGAALKFKKNKEKSIAVVFIGDGTLGEGVVYESLNLASLLKLPLLIVCEDNGYAQSTKKTNSFSGDIKKRIEGFNVEYYRSNIWDEDNLEATSIEVVEKVRESQTPIFFHIDTYRLNSHSKSDDNRDQREIEQYREIDPLVVYSKNNNVIANKIDKKISSNVNKAILHSEKSKTLSLELYIENHFEKLDLLSKSIDKSKLSKNDRVIDRINAFFLDLMAIDKRVFFIGEDILDPYGGAFKVSKGLSSKFPDRVISTPISEQGIAGMSNGMALAGLRPYLEIMFGDFMTLVFDQVLNHASKFYYMYDKQVTCPVVIRTPVGGGRGYGPTHSQAIEKYFVGIDNVRVVAINAFSDPYKIFSHVHKSAHPVIVFENKSGYGRQINQYPKDFFIAQHEDNYLGNVSIKPASVEPDVLIITYGETASKVVDLLEELFVESDIICEVYILTCLYPLNLDEAIKRAKNIKKVIVLEESGSAYGIASEIISVLIHNIENLKVTRLGSLEVPIPSIRNLEDSVLQTDKIFQKIEEIVHDSL